MSSEIFNEISNCITRTENWRVMLKHFSRPESLTREGFIYAKNCGDPVLFECILFQSPLGTDLLEVRTSTLKYGSFVPAAASVINLREARFNQIQRVESRYSALESKLVENTSLEHEIAVLVRATDLCMNK